MKDHKIATLGLKAEMGRAVRDFDTWPQWAKEIPFENSDRVMESILRDEATHAGMRRDVKV